MDPQANSMKRTSQTSIEWTEHRWFTPAPHQTPEVVARKAVPEAPEAGADAADADAVPVRAVDEAKASWYAKMTRTRCPGLFVGAENWILGATSQSTATASELLGETKASLRVLRGYRSGFEWPLDFFDEL